MTESRSNLAPLSGSRISAVEIIADGPRLPGPAAPLSVLHIPSQQRLIRRQLLFAAGDTVDTLLVGETMRRLRGQRLFADAVILAQRCDPAGGVTLVVHTRDTWTMRPTARMRSASQVSVGIEDKNILGTGRTVSLTHEITLHRTGNAFAYADPFVLGTDLAANVRVSNLGGAHTLRLGLRNHEYSVFDRWRVEGNLARLSYGDTVVADRALHSLMSMAFVGRRVGMSDRAITMFLVGADFDSASSIRFASRKSITADAPHVRSYIGGDIGILHRTAAFDTVSWVVPGRGFLDVPMGWEGEAIVGAGRSRDVGRAAGRYDAWLGRAWIPRRGTLLITDAWSSSYLGAAIDHNQIARVSLNAFAEGWRGFWGARVMVEQLTQLDPDRRGLSLMPQADYTTPIVRYYAARGERTIAGAIERDVRVARVGAASVVNVGAFGAGSYRSRVDDVTGRDLRAAVLGARLRVLSANGSVSSIRADFGVPVIGDPLLDPKPYFTLTFGTLFDVSRQRDGRRLY